MVWFKVDDSFYRSRKVRRLGADRLPAVGLWTLCGDWAADNLTDGHVPWEVVEQWDPARALSKRLLDVELWHEAEHDGEPGVLFHDWQDWQPTKASVQKRRADQRERVRRWRERHGQNRSGDASGDDARNALQDASPLSDLPDPGNALPNASVTQRLTAPPTRPDPTRKYVGGPVGSGSSVDLGETFLAQAPENAPAEKAARTAKSRATRLPDDFEVTREMVAWAQEHTPNVDGRWQTAKFKDYWAGESGPRASKRDWRRAWQTWMRNAEEQAGRARRPDRSDRGWDALKDDNEQ